MIITFCGHSNFQRTEFYEKKMMSILEDVVGQEPAEFYLGDYGAFDEFAYLCCKIYQESHPRVKLIFVTPYMFEAYQKKHLGYQKERYDEIVYPPLENVPPRYAISRRNRWMVEKADMVIAYINHEWGGAYRMYRHAQNKEKNVVNMTEKRG